MTPEDWYAREEQLFEVFRSAADESAEEAALDALDAHRLLMPESIKAGPETISAYARISMKAASAQTPEDLSAALAELGTVAHRNYQQELEDRAGQSIRAIPSGARGQSKRR